MQITGEMQGVVGCTQVLNVKAGPQTLGVGD